MRSLTIADPKLRGELEKALITLAEARDKGARTVEITLGKTNKQVGLGYLLEAPTWKTGYRLDLKEEEKTDFEGWAIVENTTDSDWKAIELTLVSGRPVSFIQDLYSPYFLQRPKVNLELFPGLRPRIYKDEIEREEPENLSMNENMGKQIRDLTNQVAIQAVTIQRQNKMVTSLTMNGSSDPFSAGAPASAPFAEGSTIEAQSLTSFNGEVFKYTIRQPVNLDRGQGAMLPIVSESLKAERLSIYNANENTQGHPMRGVRLTNTSKLKL